MWQRTWLDYFQAFIRHVATRLRLAGLAALMMSLSVNATAAAPWTAKRWELQVRAYERLDRVSPPAPGGVLFVGSSSIRQWKLLADDFPGVPVLNRGFGGAQIPDITFYADRLIVPHRPQHILFYAGENDLADGYTPEDIRSTFLMFVKRVRRDLPDARISFISIKPSPAREHLLDNTRAANALVRQAISGVDGLDYIDVFSPMLTPDGKARADLVEYDGLHINRQGYLLWRAIIGPHLCR